MDGNHQTAIMHPDASGRLLRQAIADGPRDESTEEHDIIHRYVTIAHQQCIGYAKNELKQHDEKEFETSSIFPTLVTRHSPQSITSISQIKKSSENTFDSLASRRRQVSTSRKPGDIVEATRSHF